MKITLYAHGGSGNHGCEALVRSTIGVIGRDRNDYHILSEKPDQDIYYHLDELGTIFGTQSGLPHGFQFLVYQFKMKLRKDDSIYYKSIYRSFADKVGDVDFALAIGGDNYCYKGFLERFGIQNDMLIKRGIPTALWGCSIDPERIDNKMIEDLKKYKFITARESITYQALKSSGLINVHLVPDTAFSLESQEVALPPNFIDNNTVGINVSPLIINREISSGVVMTNYCRLIDHILETTSMSIALIPHVVWDGNDDRIPLKQLYDKFKDCGRVILVDDCNACILKGYISHCRFLIAARTHASIAGYSMGVPTLVLGYSVKAKGIATDLFGTDKNYVIPIDLLQRDNALSESFDWLMNNEDAIRAIYEKRLNDYKSPLFEVNGFFK